MTEAGIGIGGLEAEQRLSLIAAATASRRETLRDEARRCVSELEWERFAATLAGRRLLALLGPRVIELSGNSAPADFRATVARSLETGRRRAALLHLVSLRAISLLADVDIRAAPLKGPTLGESLYGDPGRRASSDIDLLVPVEQLDAAAAVVQQLGYAPPADPRGKNGLPQLHLTLEHERGELPPIELHWRIHWYECAFARERLLPTSVDPTADWRPEPVAEVAALLLYYARDGLIDLRYPTDLGAWWDVRGDAIEPGELTDLITAYPALAGPLKVATTVCERLTGLPAEQLLGDGTAPSPRQRIAMWMANPNPHATTTAQLYADSGLLDGLLTPVGSLGAWVRRRLLPPRAVLEQQAQHGQRTHVRSQLGRCFGMLARYGYRLLSLPVARRRRERHLRPIGG